MNDDPIPPWPALIIECEQVLETACDVSNDFSAILGVLLTHSPIAPWQAAFRARHPPGVLKYDVEFIDSPGLPHARLRIQSPTKARIIEAYRHFGLALRSGNEEYARRRQQRAEVIGALRDAWDELE